MGNLRQQLGRHWQGLARNRNRKDDPVNRDKPIPTLSPHVLSKRPGIVWSGTAHPIIFMLQSSSPTITQRVIFKSLRDMFEAMPYSQCQLIRNGNKQSGLELASGITVVPGRANVQASVGQAILGGVLDEVNFMDVVERSKRVPGPRG